MTHRRVPVAGLSSTGRHAGNLKKVAKTNETRMHENALVGD
jgi:hypothetical protein